jgi:hypothetical protein
MAGNLKDVFARQHKRIFEEMVADVLIEPGYKKDNEWR